jgi:hypothetical protein
MLPNCDNSAAIRPLIDPQPFHPVFIAKGSEIAMESDCDP